MKIDNLAIEKVLKELQDSLNVEVCTFYKADNAKQELQLLATLGSTSVVLR